MKKLNNITAIILFIVIAFCSCTSSGKLSDAKFPYKFKYIEEHGTILPVSAGSYTIMPIFDVPCIECEVAKMHLKVVIILSIAVVLIYIGIFISDMIKPKILNYEKDNKLS